MGRLWEIFASLALRVRHPMPPLAMSVSGALRGKFASVHGFFSGQSTVEGAFLIPIILLMLMFLFSPGSFFITT